MKRLTSLLPPPFLFIFLIFPSISFSITRGISVISKEGQNLYLYKDCHTPIVGVGNYEKWPRLTNTLKDTNEVAAKLQSDKQQKEPKPVINSTNPSLEIKDITFKQGKNGKEIVAIHANRSFKPTVFAIEEYPPRIVIDIKNVNIFRRNLTLIPVDGELIKRIRIHLHKDSKTLRIVLDNSDSNKYYKVNQIFYEGNNVYVLEVIAKEEPSPKTRKR